MPERDLHTQLTKYLTDVHSIEEQALVQMKRAPEIAGDPEIAEAFSQHLHETERQEERVRDLLQAADAAPSKVKALGGRAGGVGMVLFAKFQPDTPGKLVAHAYSYEHMELAAYELLRQVAERAGEERVASVARDIGDEERRMAGRLGSVFDRAVDASLRESIRTTSKTSCASTSPTRTRSRCRRSRCSSGRRRSPSQRALPASTRSTWMRPAAMSSA